MADAPAGTPEAPKTLEDALKMIGTLAADHEKTQKELKEVVKESMGRKEKLRTYETEREKAEEKRLAEQGEYKGLVDKLKPQAERMEAVDATLKEILALEIADIPEDKRELIPQGTPEVQLKWVKQAKAKGLFSAPEGAPAAGGEAPAGSPPASREKKPASGPGTPEWMGWKPGDARLTTLSTAQYEEWKKGNNRPSASGSAQLRNQSAWG